MIILEGALGSIVNSSRKREVTAETLCFGREYGDYVIDDQLRWVYDDYEQHWQRFHSHDYSSIQEFYLQYHQTLRNDQEKQASLHYC